MPFSPSFKRPLYFSLSAFPLFSAVFLPISPYGDLTRLGKGFWTWGDWHITILFSIRSNPLKTCHGQAQLFHNFYETKGKLEVDVTEYIDYYNSCRIHQKLGQRTPIEGEDNFLLWNELLSQYRGLGLADWIELKKRKKRYIDLSQ